MQNIETWKPTKYVVRNNQLYANYVGIGSHLCAQLIADMYGKYIPEYCHGRLADIGCGFIPMYGFYKQFVSDVVTIDWVESLHVNEHLDIVADLNFVPIPETLDQSFDTIILSDVLEHIYEPQNLLRELYRILKQNGILMMNVPFYYWVHEIPHDYYRYTEYTLKRYFEELHFDIIVFERVGGLGACWNDITSKTLCRLGLPGRIVAACLTIPICLFRNTFPIKELLSAHSNNFPLGYFIVAKKV